MSVNVLVIPEDFRKDQYTLKPIVERLLREIVGSARVRVCQDPLLGGIGEAMKWERIAEIVDRYRGMTKIFLLLVDRDGEVGRRVALDALESKAAERLTGTSCVFIGENAWQEVEVWILAGLELPNSWAWAAVRAERDVKETYYDQLVRARGLSDAPHQGREVLAREAAARYPRIRTLCPEDVGNLEVRIRGALGR